MRIGDINALSMSTNYDMQAHSDSTDTALKRLSGGLRINHAADDASGMTIANQLTSRALGISQEIMNKNDEIGMMQIADGAMEEQTKILDIIRVKLIQKANASQGEVSKIAINNDITRLLESFDNITNTTQFNGKKLFSDEYEFKNGLKIEKTTVADAPEEVPTEVTSEMIANYVGGSGVYNTDDLMNIEAVRDQYDLNGANHVVVVIDNGIDADHAYFGDRVLASVDFSGSTGTLDDGDPNNPGHGTNVSSIIGSSDATYTGVAPEVGIISLKALLDDTDTLAGDTQSATGITDSLQWVIDNASAYNITAVNMSLGAVGVNSNVAQTTYDTLLKEITDMGIINVAASGNSYAANDPDQGASYPANSIYTIGVGAVFDGNSDILDGATWTETVNDAEADRITPFSQRSTEVVDIFAVGAPVYGADSTGGLDGFSYMTGTSQASPQVAGIAVLVQEYAEQELGRKLTYDEMRDLLVNTAVTINDGDDEDDTVANTGEDYKRIDALGAIMALEELSSNTDGNAAIYAYMDIIDAAAKDIRTTRASVGSTQNMLASEIAFKSIENISLRNAASQLRDADFADESQKLSKSLILSQSSSYAFAQIVQRYDAIAELLV